MKYRFIINPRSGPRKKAEKLIEKIEARFSRTDHTFDFAQTTGPGDATRLAEKAVNERIDVTVAVGGDGTVNEVATGLIRSETALGIIPRGSGNGVARSLGIPLRLNQNLDVLAAPEFDQIDGGEINGCYFFGICGIGFDARIGYKFQNFGIRGPVPYFIIGVKEFLTYLPQRLTLQLDDREVTIRPLLLAIANTTQYGNGAIIAPMADPGDGLFEICYLKNVSLTGSILALKKLFNGSIDKSRIYRHFKASKLTIFSSDNELIVHLDGEPHLFSDKLQIKLHRRVLKVVLGNPVTQRARGR